MNFTKISRELIKSLKFRPFTQQDYYGFCDVSSPIPLIAENDDEGILMIIDGQVAELYADMSDGSFEPIDQCMDITRLPVKSERQLRIEAEIASMEKALAALKAELN